MKLIGRGKKARDPRDVIDETTLTKQELRTLAAEAEETFRQLGHHRLADETGLAIKDATGDTPGPGTDEIHNISAFAGTPLSSEARIVGAHRGKAGIGDGGNIGF